METSVRLSWKEQEYYSQSSEILQVWLQTSATKGIITPLLVDVLAFNLETKTKIKQKQKTKQETYTGYILEGRYSPAFTF